MFSLISIIWRRVMLTIENRWKCPNLEVALYEGYSAVEIQGTIFIQKNLVLSKSKRAQFKPNRLKLVAFMIISKEISV